MFYRLTRSLVKLALRLFYRIEVKGGDFDSTDPIIYVGNHPNALIDPALIFAVVRRPLAFLAKAPLFRVPGLGQILRGLNAIPVHRRQDDPSLLVKNEAMFEAAVEILVRSGALMIFPEGKSHSEPSLAELKTGTARIALRTASKGQPVRIVPIGLTYEDRGRFRSRALVEIGVPLAVDVPVAGAEPLSAGSVRALTDRIAKGLQQLTVNLQSWEDLPLLRIAEELYALRRGERVGDPERMRLFARGLRIFREEQPQRFEIVRRHLMSFQQRLRLLKVSPHDLGLVYRRLEVYRFALRNSVSLLVGFPLAIVGLALFVVPFWLPVCVARVVKAEPDTEGTAKFATAVVVAPAWALGLAAVAGHYLGWIWGVVSAISTLPLALLTRHYLERHLEALRDAQVFFTVGSRARLKAGLLAEGESLAEEVERIAGDLGPRIAEPSVAG